MQRGTDHIQFAILGLVARDNAQARVVHVPDRLEHAHAVAQPIQAVGRGDAHVGQLPGGLQMAGE